MRGVWVLAAVGALAACASALSRICHRTPPGSTAPKQEGDNDFHIKISGNPAKYTPDQVYTVSLKERGRQSRRFKKFTGFLLMLEPSQVPVDMYGPRNVGIFHLQSDALTKYSDNCPNAVTQTSSIPKSEIHVRWTAPPATSGCIRFRATVVEAADVWFMDEGGLIKELCEDVQEGGDVLTPINPVCCACDEAKYEVTFEGLWSRHTHPKNFPQNEWLTYFSDIIGASHSIKYRLWEPGKEASDGVKDVAERGNTGTLESELKRKSDHIRTIIKARGLWHPNVNGKTFAVFRVDNVHHIMSLVSKLGPTPDWIVGVPALELCHTNCSWVQHRTLNLFPYDAGTDSGLTYEAANNPTSPRGRIKRITSSYPNDPQSPFFDLSGKLMNPLARLTITRQRVYEKSCSGAKVCMHEKEPGPCHGGHERWYFDLRHQQCRTFLYGGCRGNRNNFVRHEDCKELCERRNNSSPPVNCMVTEWMPWTSCSATCGKKVYMERTRTVKVQASNGGKKCPKKLYRKKKCRLEKCPTTENGFNGLESRSQRRESTTAPHQPAAAAAAAPQHGYGPEEDYISPNLYNPHVGSSSYRDEDSDEEYEYDDEELQVDCVLGEWGPWSPCTHSCGPEALQQRSRLVVVEAQHGGTPCGDTNQRRYCNLPPCPRLRLDHYGWLGDDAPQV